MSPPPHDRRPPEVDLHGLRPEEALRRLERGLHAARVRGEPTLLVITGAGHGNRQGLPVLRTRVEAWLKTPEAQPAGRAELPAREPRRGPGGRARARSRGSERGPVGAPLSSPTMSSTPSPNERRRIALISTGGTIEKTYDELSGVLDQPGLACST